MIEDKNDFNQEPQLVDKMENHRLFIEIQAAIQAAMQEAMVTMQIVIDAKLKKMLSDLDEKGEKLNLRVDTAYSALVEKVEETDGRINLLKDIYDQS